MPDRPTSTGLIIAARWLVARDGALLRDAGLWVVRGRIERVLHSAAEIRACRKRRAARVHDIGDALLAPGFVDAHAHLELSALRGRVPAGRSFAAWIGALLRARGACDSQELAAGARGAADELLAGGTTLVADVDSLGLCARALRGHPLRRIPFHELLDARDPARTQLALRRVRAALRARAPLGHGLAPHAPMTVSFALAAGSGVLARARRARLMTHWAETPEEERWLEHGSGPLSGLLHMPPRRRGLELLERAHLLGPRTLLVHGNAASRDEIARVVRSGAALVHCPGTHAFFGRPRFALADWTRAGVRLALGTDSLASNGALDMRSEIAQLLRAQPRLHPREAWLLATRGGASALGLAGRVGELREGAWADFLVVEAPARAADIWEPLVRPDAPIRAVWIGGHPLISGPEAHGKRARKLNFGRGSPQ